MGDEKSQIRKNFLLKRKKLYNKTVRFTFDDIYKLIKLNFKNKKITVAGYYPINFEVNTLNFMLKLFKKKINLALPIITKNYGMLFKKWTPGESMYLNKYGIPEPSKSCKTVIPDVILVPLVAFDKNLNRLGYGAGYYDRVLKKISLKNKVFCIGIAFSFQKYSNIPINKNDYALDCILTEQKIIDKRNNENFIFR